MAIGKSSPAPAQREAPNHNLTLQAVPSSRQGVEPAVHDFHAVAFVDQLALRELTSAYPEADHNRQRLQSLRPFGGRVFVFGFGAIVFHNVTEEGRTAELERLGKMVGTPSAPRVLSQHFLVHEGVADSLCMVSGGLNLDRLTPEQTSVVATTLAQSVAMEYYEGLVEEMSEQTRLLVQEMQSQGTVGFAMRPLQKFMGQALGTRNQVLSVLHRLDTPDEVWSSPRLKHLYETLRTEFDLAERYQAIEVKLNNVRDAAELILGVARDRRLVLLEVTIALLILIEIALTFLH